MRALILSAALITTATGSLPGQRLSLTPQIGFYVPTEKLAKLASGGSTSEIEAGPSFGARLGLWFGSRVGLETSGSYVPTTFKLAGGTSELVSERARLFVGSSQLVVFLLPRTGLLTLWVGGGVGVVSRGGVAFTGAADRTDVGGTLGGGAGINLGSLALNLSADVLGYSAGHSSGLPETTIRQRDVHLKLGFGIPVGGGQQPSGGLGR